MANVSYHISIGSKTYEADRTTLKSLQVHSTLKTPVNQAIIVLAVNESFGTGDPVSIALGHDGKTEKVFTGEVRSVEYSLEATTVSATSTASLFTGYYLDKGYEKQSCGAIVKDLAGMVGVRTGTVAEGITFPFLTLSGAYSALHHLQTLAAYSGADLFSDPEDQLYMAPYAQKPGKIFTYGESILEVEKETLEPEVDGVVVFGESTGKGDEGDYWFKKAEVKGTAGSTKGAVKRLAIYAARTKDLCKTLATNLYEATRIKARGRILVLNGEKATIGGTISLKGLPEKSANGSYKVTAIRHVINRDEGFTTEINWEEHE